MAVHGVMGCIRLVNGWMEDDMSDEDSDVDVDPSMSDDESPYAAALAAQRAASSIVASGAAAAAAARAQRVAVQQSAPDVFDGDTTAHVPWGGTVLVSNPPSHVAYIGESLEFDDDAPNDDEDDDDDVDESATAPLPPPPTGLPVKAHPAEPDITAAEYYARFVARTQAQCDAERAAPQRSAAWHAARAVPITGSAFGAAAGESPYQQPDELVADKLWNNFTGNAFTRWGTRHEPHAHEAFERWFKGYLARRGGGVVRGTVRLEDDGLIKTPARPWAGVSPDGILRYTDADGSEHLALVEYKCPAMKRDTVRHPYAAAPQNVPPQYRAQVQGNAWHLRTVFERPMDEIWFVVWQARRTWVTRLPLDSAYATQLLATLERFYFTRLLPALVHRYNGALRKGEIVPHATIDLAASSAPCPSNGSSSSSSGGGGSNREHDEDPQQPLHGGGNDSGSSGDGGRISKRARLALTV